MRLGAVELACKGPEAVEHLKGMVPLLSVEHSIEKPLQHWVLVFEEPTSFWDITIVVFSRQDSHTKRRPYRSAHAEAVIEWCVLYLKLLSPEHAVLRLFDDRSLEAVFVADPVAVHELLGIELASAPVHGLSLVD